MPGGICGDCVSLFAIFHPYVRCVFVRFAGKQKTRKKLEKSLEKYLTNGGRRGIIEKLSGTGDGSGGHRSLKIGQQNFEH